MSRAFRQQIDDGILDRAAALFARQGLRKTSVQDIATAVGLSKAGLLHHFPTKDAIHDAVLALAGTLGERLTRQVADLPPGPGRDRRALEAVLDIAAAHPGLVSLMLSPPGPAGDPHDTAAAVLGIFGVDPEFTDTDRLVRVIGALSALAVLTIAAHHPNRGADQSSAWRPHILQTCYDALGHPSI